MTTFSVPDMSCGHCKRSIETALAALPDAAPVVVDLASRQVTAGGTASDAAILAALDEIGYPATPVAAS